MRLHVLFAAAALLLTAMAGCLGDSDDGDHDHNGHDDNGHGHNGHGHNETDEPEPEPNEPPVLDLRVTDAGGNETHVTVVGGSLTFDGSGSFDPDGELAALAVVVQDSNQTRFAQLLQGGQFAPASFGFDRPGVVDVTLNGIDDRGATATLRTNVYINHPQSEPPSGAFNLPLAMPEVYSPDACEGPTGQGLVDPQYWRKFSFTVRPGATFVEAWAETDDPGGLGVEFALCTPDGEPISPVDAEYVLSDPGVAFRDSLDYYASVVSRGISVDIQMHFLVHYEPDERGVAGDEDEDA